MRFQYSKYTAFAAMLLVLFCFSSCLGLKSGIEINSDGSGTIDLVYTISETLNSMGTQDGNISQPPVPVSKLDFEKTVSQIDGLSLHSYKSEVQGAHVLTFVTLDFANIEALAAFFDENNQTIRFTQNGNRKELVFAFNDVPVYVDAHEQALFTKALDGYMFEFSLKTHGTMEAAFVDQNGNAVKNANAENLSVKNNALDYQVPMADLIFAKEPVILNIVF
ncbi:MAG: hypothetical protein LBV20_00770 [Treponema sp.]|nr:hypothetical protein [Treponema sp.]